MSRMQRTLLPAFLLCLSVCTAAPAEEGQLRVTADSITREQTGDILRAVGDVRMDWQGYSLLADKVEYAGTDQTAQASGLVRLLQGDDELTGDNLKLRLDTRQGEMTNGRLRTREGNLRVKGSLLEKRGDDEYRMERGSFTTCDADPPAWKFTASDLDVVLEGFATGRNVVFSVGEIPVFYTPYILFPVKRERQTGFLFPRLGSSTKKGFFFDLPYYWAISPSAEATIDLDIQSRRGMGLGVDASWLGRQGSHGAFNAYSIYDTNLGRDRSQIGATVKEAVTGTTDFNADILLSTDRSFFRDFAEASGDYNRQALDSSVSLANRWDSWYLAGEARILNDLDSLENQKTLQRLPEITLTGTGQRLAALPLYAGFGGRLTNFYRREGVRGQRLVVQPTLAYYADLPDGLALGGWGGYQQRLYNASDGAGDGGKGTGLALAGAAASSSFTRIYEPGGREMVRLRHLLEPAIVYSFVQDKNQGNLPFFDYDDRVIGQSLLNWSLTSVLTGRFAPAGTLEYRDLLMVRLSQGYQISGGRRDLLNGADAGRPLTDIRLEARAEPLRSLSIETDSRFSPYHAEVTNSTLSATLHDLQGNETGIAYSRISGSLDYLEGKLSLNLVKPVVLQYTGRYSFDRRDFLEEFYAIEYRHQCWSVNLSYRDRRDNKEFLVNFSLAGIGGLGKVKLF